MASAFVDGGLSAIWQRGTGANTGATPAMNTINLVTASFTPGPTLVYSSLTFSGTHAQTGITAGWGFTLDTTNHWVIASKAFTFTFTGLEAGTTFYGIGIYDNSTNTLVYSETFAAPYTVPTGGGSLIFTANLKYGDCAFA